MFNQRPFIANQQKVTTSHPIIKPTQISQPKIMPQIFPNSTNNVQNRVGFDVVNQIQFKQNTPSVFNQQQFPKNFVIGPQQPHTINPISISQTYPQNGIVPTSLSMEIKNINQTQEVPVQVQQKTDADVLLEKIEKLKKSLVYNDFNPTTFQKTQPATDNQQGDDLLKSQRKSKIEEFIQEYKIYKASIDQTNDQIFKSSSNKALIENAKINVDRIINENRVIDAANLINQMKKNDNNTQIAPVLENNTYQIQFQLVDQKPTGIEQINNIRSGSFVGSNQNFYEKRIKELETLLKQSYDEIASLKQQLSHYQSAHTQKQLLFGVNLNHQETQKKRSKIRDIQPVDTRVISENVQILQEKVTQEADLKFIVKSLSKNNLFSDLSQENLQKLAQQMFMCEVGQGQYIFKQGDQASCYFLIKSGTVNVIVNENFKKSQGAGSAFGELALLYNDTRQASIKTTTKCILFGLDRAKFKNVIKEISITQFSENLKLLEKIDFFQLVSDYQKAHIAEALINLHYQKNDLIMEEGDAANCFFIIKEGQAEVFKNDQVLSTLQQNQTFGESALNPEHSQRMANIRAKTDLKLLSLGRDQLVEILGCDLNKLRYRKIIENTLKLNNAINKLSSIQIEKLINEFLNNMKSVQSGHVLFRAQDVSHKKIIIILEGTFSNQKGQIEQVQNQNNKGVLYGDIFLIDANYIPKSNISMAGNGNIAEIDLKKFIQIMGGNYLSVVNSNTGSHEIIIKSNSVVKKQKISIKELLNIKQLGQGAFGTVFLVTNMQKTQKYALKCIPKQLVIEQGVENLLKIEKQVMEKISCPFIMEFFNSEKDNNYIYFILSYIQGMDLFQIIYQKLGRLSIQHTKFYTAQIILALEYLKNQNIIHRDMKPENIMIDHDGFLKIIDMGLAKIIDQKFNVRCFTFLGTPVYIAPEMFQGKGYSFEVDLWALGCMVYEMISGQVPYGVNAAEPMQIYNEILTKPLKFAPNLFDLNSRKLITQLLSKQPAQRLGISYTSLKAHPWFDDVQWDKIYHKQLKAPFIPQITSNNAGNNPHERLEPMIQVINKLQSGTKKSPVRSKHPNWDLEF